MRRGDLKICCADGLSVDVGPWSRDVQVQAGRQWDLTQPARSARRQTAQPGGRRQLVRSSTHGGGLGERARDHPTPPRVEHSLRSVMAAPRPLTGRVASPRATIVRSLHSSSSRTLSHSRCSLHCRSLQHPGLQPQPQGLPQRVSDCRILTRRPQQSSPQNLASRPPSSNILTWLVVCLRCL